MLEKLTMLLYFFSLNKSFYFDQKSNHVNISCFKSKHITELFSVNAIKNSISYKVTFEEGDGRIEYRIKNVSRRKNGEGNKRSRKSSKKIYKIKGNK